MTQQAFPNFGLIHCTPQAEGKARQTKTQPGFLVLRYSGQDQPTLDDGQFHLVLPRPSGLLKATSPKPVISTYPPQTLLTGPVEPKPLTVDFQSTSYIQNNETSSEQPMVIESPLLWRRHSLEKKNLFTGSLSDQVANEYRGPGQLSRKSEFYHCVGYEEIFAL
ncbi:unnamed protein product [Protopolystoma xenopodis]|uniref:Uncharacterized protein n=1 Tax=Protopolystoma xenopodis TaxID=117903 RepID=A0A3S4ZGW8_9PLAT|nr:unnamed protein product [Protopolystoma xenopodis]